MFLARRGFFSKIRGCFNYGVYKPGDISMDLLLTLSMQEADKKYKNNDELVESLVAKNLLKTDLLIQGMKKLDRSYFVPSVDSSLYQDRPYSIGQGEDFSAPMMQAIAAETLFPVITNIGEKEPLKVIDVGTGSGYLPLLLYYALSAKFQHHPSLNLSILGIDVQEEFVKKTNLLFADLIEKEILTPHPSILLKFAKREFYDYIGSPNLTGSENRVFNIGAAIDLQTWEALKSTVARRRGAILSPVVQPDGEQALMFYRNDESKPEEISLMKVMYAQMKKSEKTTEKVDPNIAKYFLDDSAKGEEVPEEAPTVNSPQQEQIEQSSSSVPVSEAEKEELLVKSLKVEIRDLENQIKSWTEKFRAGSNKPVSLKDMKSDPKMIEVLEKLNKEKRKLGILQRAINASNTQK